MNTFTTVRSIEHGSVHHFSTTTSPYSITLLSPLKPLGCKYEFIYRDEEKVIRERGDDYYPTLWEWRRKRGLSYFLWRMLGHPAIPGWEREEKEVQDYLDEHGRAK
jgi:hypothetical protein